MIFSCELTTKGFHGLALDKTSRIDLSMNLKNIMWLGIVILEMMSLGRLIILPLILMSWK